MAVSRKVIKALKEAGAVLKSKSKNEVYVFPNGSLVTISVNTNCCHAEQNQLSDIKRAKKKLNKY